MNIGFSEVLMVGAYIAAIFIYLNILMIKNLTRQGKISQSLIKD